MHQPEAAFQTITEILTTLSYNPNLHESYPSDLELIDDHNFVFRYIKSYRPINDQDQFFGYTSVNKELTHTLTLPPYVEKPPEFDSSIYKTDPDGKSFTKPDQIRYLATFNASSFFRAYSQFFHLKEFQLAKFLLEKSFNQSRIVDIWTQTLCCVIISEALKARENRDSWRPNRRENLERLTNYKAKFFRIC